MNSVIAKRNKEEKKNRIQFVKFNYCNRSEIIFMDSRLLRFFFFFFFFYYNIHACQYQSLLMDIVINGQSQSVCFSF